FYLIDSLFSNIKLDRKGISFQSDIIFSEDTEKLLSSFNNNKDIKKWGSYLPEEAFIQSIYSLDSKDYQMVLDNIIDYLFPEDEKDPLSLELKQNMDIFSQYLGNGGAFSIDITPNMDVTNEDIFPFDFSLRMVLELSNSDKFINEFRNFYTNQSLNKIMNNLYNDPGFSLQLNMEEKSFNELSPVFKIKYDIKKKRLKSNSNSNEMDPVMNFLNNIENWYHIADNKLYSYMGSNGFEGLKQLTLANNKEKDWVNTAPNDSNVVWNVSLTNILTLLDTLPELGEMIPANNLSFDVSGFSSIENGSIYSSTLISAENIGNVFEVFRNMNF
ncbi:MAG: hypothetical protein PF693_11810, partial [Spirochaetia bacterium]|nr:hypothetical protein [Spirochaetia bacterium]